MYKVMLINLYRIIGNKFYFIEEIKFKTKKIILWDEADAPGSISYLPASIKYKSRKYTDRGGIFIEEGIKE